MKENELKLWNSYQRNFDEKEILDYIATELKKIVDWYSEYYRKEEVLAKFKNKSNGERLIENLRRIRVVSHFRPQGNSADRAWGYIYTNNLFTVFLNIYNFFNGRINASISDTIIHEIGHLIDFQLRRMRERPSYLEPSVLRSTPKDDYIVSREEDYARIQRLRILLNLSPLADVSELGNGINTLIKSNSMLLEDFNLEIKENKMFASFIQSKIRSLSLSELSSVFGGIVINGFLATDIGYLFAKYSRVVNGVIEVDLDRIAKINKLFVDNNNNSGFNSFGSGGNFG